MTRIPMRGDRYLTQGTFDNPVNPAVQSGRLCGFACRHALPVLASLHCCWQPWCLLGLLGGATVERLTPISIRSPFFTIIRLTDFEPAPCRPLRLISTASSVTHFARSGRVSSRDLYQSPPMLARRLFAPPTWWPRVACLIQPPRLELHPPSSNRRIDRGR
jgi:hypothetical protein